MKKRNYERTTLIIFMTIIIGIIELVYVVLLFNNKIYDYQKFNSIYVDNNLIVYVDKLERKIFYKNSYLYIDNKKLKYKIFKDNGVALKKNKKEYYELYLSVKINEKYKLNDNIEITLQDKKIRLIEIFKLIWGG